MAQALDFISVKISSQGQAVGPQIDGSLFIPFGIGLVFDAGDGTFWQLRLAQTAAGALFLGPDGKPTIELVQVTP